MSYHSTLLVCICSCYTYSIIYFNTCLIIDSVQRMFISYHIHMFWSISIYIHCIIHVCTYLSSICTDKLYLLFKLVIFVIICIIIIYWLISFSKDTIGTPIAGRFELNKSWGVPELTHLQVKQNDAWWHCRFLDPMTSGSRGLSTNRWMLVWLLYHYLLTASKPWISRLYVNLRSEKNVPWSFDVHPALYHPFSCRNYEINQPVCRNGLRGFFGTFLLCVEVLQKVLWRKTVRVLPLIVCVIVQAQHPWVVCIGFHSFTPQMSNDLLGGVPDIEICRVRPDMKDVCWVYLCL